MQYVFWSPQLVSDAQGTFQKMGAQKLQVSKIEAENAVRKTDYFQDLERQYSSAIAEAIELNSSVLDDPEGSAKAFIEAMRDVPDFNVEPSYVVSVYNRKQTEGRVYQVSATGEIMGWTDAEKFNRKVRQGTETRDLEQSAKLESTDK